MPTSNNPKRQKGGEENSTPSTTASATRAEEEDEDIITTTTQRINRTFDEAKENTRRAVQEAERELPRYMQIVTTNQEQSVGAVRDTIENYLDSQREITNFIQSFWKSYIDNVLWTPTRRAIENYAASVSNTTVAAIRIYNNIIYANAEAVRLSLEYNRDNAREMSRVFVNTAKQLEKI
jgi:F0F1-type ATP synthase membrane subunit b/b'